MEQNEKTVRLLRRQRLMAMAYEEAAALLVNKADAMDLDPSLSLEDDAFVRAMLRTDIPMLLRKHA